MLHACHKPWPRAVSGGLAPEPSCRYGRVACLLGTSRCRNTYGIQALPNVAPGVVETLCKVLAATDWPGLSGSEIGRLLAMRGFEDVAPDAAKWRRLDAAMQTRQQRDRASNCLIRFITDAMEPSRYVDDPGRFSALQDNLNESLALVGLKIRTRESCPGNPAIHSR